MKGAKESEPGPNDGQALLAENTNQRELLSLEPPLLTLNFSEYYRQHLLSLA